MSIANAGVGASVSYDSVSRDTEAFIGDPSGAAASGSKATIQSGGNVIVDAKNSGILGTLSLAAAKVSSNSGASGGSGNYGIGISGDVSINQVTDTTLAYLHDAQVTAPALTVSAANPTLFITVSGSAALVTSSSSTSLGIAGSYDQNSLSNCQTEAFLDNANLTLTGDCTISASTTGQMYAIAASGSFVPGNSGIAVAGQVSVNTISFTTSAYESDQSSISAANVSLTSLNKAGIFTIAGALA